MKASTRKQIKSGLRIGGGVGLFLIALIPAGIGAGMLLPEVGRVRLWPTAAIAVALIALGMGLMMVSARYAALLLAGFFLVGILKILFALGLGAIFQTPYRSIASLEAGQLALFMLMSLALMYRPLARPPNLLERVMFAVYVLCLCWSLATPHFSIMKPTALTGLVALAVPHLWTQILRVKKHSLWSGNHRSKHSTHSTRRGIP